MSGLFIFALVLLAQATGTLDTSFSGDGFTSFPAAFRLTAADIAVQPDGKTVVVGKSDIEHTLSDGRTFIETRFAVARFNLDGTLDATFGTGGLVGTQLGIQTSFAEAVAIAPDGRIVVVGAARLLRGLNIESLAAIAVYKPNGTLDETFDGNGLRTIDISESDAGGPRDTIAKDVAVQADGKIVVVGGAQRGVDFDFFAMRLSTNGQLDRDVRDSNFNLIYRGFFFDGVITIGMGGDDIAQAVKIDDSGNISIAGSVEDYNDSGRRGIGMVRLTTFGVPLGSFSSDGTITFLLSPNPEIRDMILHPDGKMVVAGHTDNGDFFIARFTALGHLDDTFGGQGNGFATTDVGGFDIVAGMTPAPSGTGNGFIVSGSSSGRFAAVKYTQNGLLDTAFGVGGRAILNVGSGPANIARGPGRRFMLAGGADFTTARVLDAGANVVSAGALTFNVGEGLNNGTLIVGRTERLPVPTRVFFKISGTAAFSPTFGSDYQLAGMTIGKDGTPFVDIPANATSVFVTVAPINDTLVESTETATFTIVPDANYEIGTPGSGTIDILDNDVTFLSLKVGTGTLTPSASELPANGKITYTVEWTVPQPRVWRDLATIEFRIVDEFGQKVLAWILWDETTNEISLRDPETGLFTEESGQPGSNQKLKAGDVELDLRNSTVVGSGPTGPSVTLTLALKLKSKRPGGLTGPLIYSVEVFASDDDGDKQGFDEVGTLRVL